jgi:hypothetical protein
MKQTPRPLGRRDGSSGIFSEPPDYRLVAHHEGNAPSLLGLESKAEPSRSGVKIVPDIMSTSGRGIYLCVLRVRVELTLYGF